MGRVDSSRVFRNRGRAALLFAIASIGVAAACSTPPSTSTAGARPSGASSSTSGLTPLTRSVHPFAKPQFDLGRRDPSIPTAGSLYFQPTAQQVAARDALVAAVQEPTSPSYHKWLTPSDFAARFGAQPADIARVTKWL